MIALRLTRIHGEPAGLVAQGVHFDDGSVILKWMTEPRSEERYASWADFERARLQSGNLTCDMWRVSKCSRGIDCPDHHPEAHTDCGCLSVHPTTVESSTNPEETK